MACISNIIKATHKLPSCCICGMLVVVLLLSCLSKPAYSISDEQRKAISQNCVTIKQTLGQLQRVDSRARIYLGTAYETIVNRFIIPLNLRLIKNNRSSFSEIQSNFNSEQLDFRNAYTEYMREMENLVNIDCQVNPDNFYNQLVVVREKRSILRETTVKLSQLADEQYLAVKLLKDTL